MTLESRINKIEQEADRRQAEELAPRTGVSVAVATEMLRQARAIRRHCPTCEAQPIPDGQGMADIEPCLRCYAEKLDRDPDAVVVAAQRILGAHCTPPALADNAS